mmetsp:Transcript_59347/g.120949  ORF Transcript_59347/g.120949 Transcript_59347/m.120949 type:complete len:409 (+) Transcript_59347:78-1304(+)
MTVTAPRFGCVDQACAPGKIRTTPVAPGAIDPASSEASTMMGPTGTPSTDTSLSEAASSQSTPRRHDLDANILGGLQEIEQAPDMEEAGKAKRRRRPRRRGGSGRSGGMGADSTPYRAESAGDEDAFFMGGSYPEVPTPCRPVGAVVTLDDLGIKLGPCGVPTTGAASPPPAWTATAPAQASPARVLHQRPPPPAPLASVEAAWAPPVSPCRARAGPRGDLMSTSPVAQGPCTSVLAAACEASERQPTKPATPCSLHHGAPMSTPAPRPMLSTVAARPIPAALTGDASARHQCMVTSPDASARQSPDASARQCLVTSPVHEGSWVCPSSPSRASRGIMSTSPPAPLMSTAPPAPPKSSSPGTAAREAVSPAGSPTADALRSLFHASGVASMEEAHKRLLSMAPEIYED